MSSAPVRARVDPSRALDELLALYLAALATTHDALTVETYTAYARRFIEAFGNSMTQINAATLGDYQRRRLGEVLRGTVQKERSFLNGFLDWCVEQGVLLEVYRPTWPKLPKRAVGVRTGPQRAKPVAVSLEEVGRFLMALPAWSKVRHGQRHAIRARFVVAYETGLRPATLDVLSVPEHWQPGQRYLEIRDQDDKARYGRRVPLSPLALAALEATAQGPGLIFGAHDYRVAVEAARAAAGLPEDFAPYDLRHGRAQHLLDASQDMRAVAYQLGHRLLTTTNRYLRGDEEGAARAVSFGANLGPGEMGDMSAKEGNRTLKGVTPLEPESSVPEQHPGNHSLSVCQEGPGEDAEKGGSGVGPYARAADWLMRRIVGRAEAIEVGIPRVTGGGPK